MLKAKNTLPSRSKRMIFLFIASFSLLCLLAWQAFKAVSQQRLVASKVLVEYAQLATEEFSRRIIQDIGYRGFFLEINRLSQKIKDSGYPLFDSWKKDGSNCIPVSHSIDQPPKSEIQDPTLSFVYFLKDHLGVRFSSVACDKNVPYEFISHQITLLESDTKSVQPSKNPYRMVHTEYEGKAVSLALTYQDERFYGYVVDREALIVALEKSFSRRALLPEVLADGKASNEMVDLSVFDHRGNNLVKPRNSYPTNLTSEKHLSTEYGGVFDKFVIKVSIDPDSLDQLIIGGLPSDNLPLIILTLMATLGVFITSIFQILKERKLNRLRESFIAEVSHELRTPLTQIRMFSEMLSTGKSRNEKERLHYAKIIHRESIRLSHLISNVLSYSKSRTRNTSPNKLVLSNQNIRLILQEAIEEFLPIAEMNGSKIEANLADCNIPVDADRLKRVVNNLLDNAIKYGPEKQTIFISIVKNKKTKTCRINVVDQGVIIPKIHRDDIWNAYYRLPSENKKAISGTGIGLSIVKQLVGELNASIWLEKNSDVNSLEGNHFVVEWHQSSIDIARGETDE